MKDKVINFFYPLITSYSYKIPSAVTKERIETLFKEKSNLWSSKDITGSFINDNAFVMNLISPSNTRGVTYSSTLVGTVEEANCHYLK